MIVKVHPDKFQDEQKIHANNLSVKIIAAQRDFNELTILKLEVDNFINNKIVVTDKKN